MGLKCGGICSALARRHVRRPFCVLCRFFDFHFFASSASAPEVLQWSSSEEFQLHVGHTRAMQSADPPRSVLVRDLASTEDETCLSGLMCLLRAQIEVFAATPGDLSDRTSKKINPGGGGPSSPAPITPGRVGIRCKHCAHLPRKARAKGAVSYPNSIRIMNQAVRNWQRYHFGVCGEIPATVKERYDELKAGRRMHSSKASQEYWPRSCHRLGLVDGPDGGIFFGGDAQALQLIEEATARTEEDDGDSVEIETEMPPLPQTEPAPEALLAEVPAFTPQDEHEQRELDSLTLQERMEWQSDLLGITTGVSSLAVASSAAVGNISDMGSLATAIVRRSFAATAGQQDFNAAVSSNEQPNQGNNIGWATTLSRLEQEMAALPTQQTEAYRRAQHQCPDEVSDRRKMVFVEYNNGSVAEAAARLALYWKERLSAFGHDRAFLPMTLAGAMKDEVVPMINYPILQRLPVDDAAGRPIVYVEPSRRNFTMYSPDQEVRAMMYMFETLLEDDEARWKGYVVLYNAQDVQQHQANRALTKRIVNLLENVFPIRVRASHLCHPTTFMFYVLLPIMKMFLPKELRVRIKLHYGDTDKVLRELDGFCLSRDRVPDSLGGDLHCSINQWVLDRMALENQRLMLQIRSAGLSNFISTNTVQTSASTLVEDHDDSAATAGPASSGKRCRRSATKVRSKLKQSVKAPSITAAVSSSLHAAGKKSKEAKKQANRKAAKSQRLDQIRGLPRLKYREPDPRMQRAVDAKIDDPTLPLYDALVVGGFVFRDDPSVKNGMIDMDGTTLSQRKNNLCRRVRLEKEKRANATEIFKPF